MRYYRLCIFLALSSFALCIGWKGNRTIYGSGELIDKTFTHINIDTAFVHNFVVLPSKVVHRTYRTKLGKLHTIFTGKTTNRIDVIHTKHNAANNGTTDDDDEQIICAVVESSRSGKYSKNCKAVDKSGCRDIFIIESTDEGNTWSAPIRVPRKNMNDVIHRENPSIVYDREAITIYITYTVINPVTKSSNIGFVGKDMSEEGHKKGYEKESIINLRGGLLWSDSKIAITNPKKDSGILHMIVRGLSHRTKAQSIFYTQSKDQGETWTKPHDLTAHDHTMNHHAVIGSVSVYNSKELFVVYVGKNMVLSLIYSENNGLTWSKPIRVNKRNSNTPFIKVCGQTKALGVLISSYVEKGFPHYELGYFNMTTKTFSTIPRPFVGPGGEGYSTISNGFPTVDCTGLSPNKVAFVATNHFKNLAMFDDFGYDYPE